MRQLAFKTKRLLIQKLERGEPVGHPVYVEKSIPRQLWEMIGKPAMFVTIGFVLGALLV